MGFEDVDWCLRAWQAGWQVMYYRRTSLTHLESVSRGTSAGEREVASQQRSRSRWGGWLDRRDVDTSDGVLRLI